MFYEIRYVKFEFSSFINNITIVTLSLTNRFYLPNHRYSLILPPPFKTPIFFILFSVKTILSTFFLLFLTFTRIL
jgi:hypothetical protein